MAVGFLCQGIANLWFTNYCHQINGESTNCIILLIFNMHNIVTSMYFHEYVMWLEGHFTHSKECQDFSGQKISPYFGWKVK